MNSTMGPVGRGLEIAGAALLLYRAFGARSMLGRLALAAAGGGLLFLGATGRTDVYGRLASRIGPPGRPLRVTRTIQIERSPEELYAYWRNFENLPRIMRHLESVQVLDERRSLWRARGPLGSVAEWEAEVTHDVPNREIGWRTLPGSTVENSGVVRFEPSPVGNGTQLQVEMEYTPPAGRLGASVARLFGAEPQQQLDDDLQRFKEMIEGARIPTVEPAVEHGGVRPS